jgi:hypothetical protein
VPTKHAMPPYWMWTTCCSSAHQPTWPRRAPSGTHLASDPGYAVGCNPGAVCEVVFGQWSPSVPGGLALFALAIGLAVNLDGKGGP